jgi:predicted transcriptional regulator
MPRVRITLPDGLLQHAATMASEQDKELNDLFVEAIEDYVKVHQTASPGSLRSRAIIIPRGSPQLGVQMPEELYKRADQLGKRLGKRRDALYGEALVRWVMRAAPADSAFDQGHDLPTGAWRAKGSG